MQTIDSVDFENIIKQDLVLIDFYADWCGPCKMLISNLEKLEETTKLSIKKVNVDASHDLAKRYGVMSIPTLILFSKGKEIKKKVGYLTYDELETFVNENIKE